MLKDRQKGEVAWKNVSKN